MVRKNSVLGATLYFHFPCFDGVISAVLAIIHLEGQGRKFERLCPVDYSVRESWLLRKLAPGSGVVDFLYHPGAEFWADHHATTFLTEEAKLRFESSRGATAIYDSGSDSCASLIWRSFSEWPPQCRGRLEEMVRWADKIDSARYSSVDEALFGTSPALRISQSLARADSRYASFLIGALRKETLGAVADRPQVQRRFDDVASRIAAGLERFRDAAHLEEGDIASFDLRASRRYLISRYAPFYCFPQARYSLGVIRLRDRAKITAMRNPWQEFPSVPLGKIFARHGGGGHERVASVVLPGPRAEMATDLLGELLSEIRKEEASPLAISRELR